MAAQTQFFENDLLGAFPALLLVLVLILTALGIVAHASFAPHFGPSGRFVSFSWHRGATLGP